MEPITFRGVDREPHTRAWSPEDIAVLMAQRDNAMRSVKEANALSIKLREQIKSTERFLECQMKLSKKLDNKIIFYEHYRDKVCEEFLNECLLENLRSKK